jgi:hypothetical protein
MMTVPMHTLPSAEPCHHRWPPWARLGLVTKPFAGSNASVTPRQPAAVVAAVVIVVAAVVVVTAVVVVVTAMVLDRPAVT